MQARLRLRRLGLEDRLQRFTDRLMPIGAAPVAAALA